MPLLYPYAYIICYDLYQPFGLYEPFFEELKRSYRWWRYMNSTWVVLRYEALVELAPKLRLLIFEGDRLLIQPAKGPSDGWLPKDAWEWLKENVPNEW